MPKRRRTRQKFEQVPKIFEAYVTNLMNKQKGVFHDPETYLRIQDAVRSYSSNYAADTLHVLSNPFRTYMLVHNSHNGDSSKTKKPSYNAVYNDLTKALQSCAVVFFTVTFQVWRSILMMIPSTLFIQKLFHSPSPPSPSLCASATPLYLLHPLTHV